MCCGELEERCAAAQASKWLVGGTAGWGGVNGLVMES